MKNLETKKSDLIKPLERLSIHDHLCLIYESREEQLAAAIPFIKIGLGRHEQCIYIVDENTSKVVAENELRRAHDELETRVRERTSELALANEALKAKIA